MIPLGNIFSEIEAERLRQDEFVRAGKFPFNCAGQAPLTSKLAILGEEFGEVSECVVEIELIGKGKKSIADLRKEVLHVATVAVAWLETL
jgi:hypothetical protein